MTTDIDDLMERWRDAERNGEPSRLGGLLTDDFLGIGPVGFVLPKAQWVGRLGPDLRYHELDLDELSSRTYGGATVVVAHQHARGEARGNPLPAETRVSFVVVPDDDELRIASIQYSFMAPS